MFQIIPHYNTISRFTRREEERETVGERAAKKRETRREGIGNVSKTSTGGLHFKDVVFIVLLAPSKKKKKKRGRVEGRKGAGGEKERGEVQF